MLWQSLLSLYLSLDTKEVVFLEGWEKNLPVSLSTVLKGLTGTKAKGIGTWYFKGSGFSKTLGFTLPYLDLVLNGAPVVIAGWELSIDYFILNILINVVNLII